MSKTFRFETEEDYERFMAERKNPGAAPVTVEPPKPRKKRVNREEQAQIEVFTVLYWNEKKYPELKWVHASMNGATGSSKSSQGRRKATGQKAGVSDIVLPHPRRGFGSGWIELKIKPNTVSPEQHAFLKAMQDAGNFTAIAWSAEEVFDFIDYYYEIKLTRLNKLQNNS